MRKFIVIKNKQLDLLCEKLTSYAPAQKKVNAPLLELIVTKIDTDSDATPNIHFVYTEDGATSVIPTEELVRQTMDLNGNVTGICVQ